MSLPRRQYPNDGGSSDGIIERHKNQDSASFFVNTWYGLTGKTVKEIKDEVAAGDLSWIDRITYYCQKIPGSPGYWRARRSGLYSLINHHVNKE